MKLKIGFHSNNLLKKQKRSERGQESLELEFMETRLNRANKNQMEAKLALAKFI